METKNPLVVSGFKIDDVVKLPQSIVNASYGLTPRQFSVFILLVNIYQKLSHTEGFFDEDGFFRVSRATLTKFLKYQPNRKEIRALFSALRKADIIANYLEKDGESVEHEFGFVSESKIRSNSFSILFPTKLRKALEKTDESTSEDTKNEIIKAKAIFHLVNTQVISSIIGKHEQKIYNFCKDYAGVKNTKYLTIEEFRVFMGLRKGEYPTFKSFNYYVISKPVENINNNTLAEIEVEPIFKPEMGRKKLGLYFKVKHKTQQQLEFPELENNTSFQFAKVTILPSDKVAYLALRSPEDIALCIERANEYAETLIQKGKHVDYGGLYNTAINKGWNVEYAEKKKRLELAGRNIDKKKTQDEIDWEERENSAKLADKQREEREEIIKWFDDLPHERQNAMRKDYEMEATQTILESWNKAKARFPESPETATYTRVNFFIFVEEIFNSYQ